MLRAFLVIIGSFTIVGIYDVQPAAAISGPCYFNTTAGAVTGTGSCSAPGPAGNYGTNDVLTGRSTSGAGSAIPSHIGQGGTNQQRINELVNFVLSRFNGGTHNKVGAAFIMQTMRGDRGWPTTADRNNWVERMNQPGVTVNRASVPIHRSSWYDPGKHNTFFQNYSPGNRMSIIVRYNGSVRAVIETGCGNLANNPIPLPDPPKWGPMTALTKVNRDTVRPGQNVRWDHEVWNTGNVGNDRSPFISGDVFWHGNTTGPIPAADRVGGPNAFPNEVQPDKSYNRRFDRGRLNGATRVYTFTVPNNAQHNDRYCQFINGDPTASNDGGGFNSRTHPNSEICVRVENPPTISCDNLVVPSEVDSQTPSFTITAYGSGSALANVRLVLTDPNGTATTRNRSATGSAANQQAQFTFNNPGAFVLGEYTAVATFTLAGATPDSCTETFDIADRPYLSVYGGDVMAGAYPLPSGDCDYNNPSSGVLSWNHDAKSPYGASDYAGAGGTTGVFARSSIRSFSSGLNITNLKPQGVSFANRGGAVNIGSALYGGQFGTIPTACDFVDSAGSTPAPATIGSQTVPTSTSRYYYRSGSSVYINGPITYAGTGGWSQINDIPSFKLVVVGGNIYINRNVNELSGSYIAIPSGGVGGNIYTCASGPGSRVSTTNSSYRANCSTQLKVYGSFVAKHIYFDRTANTLSQARGNHNRSTDLGAEVFLFGPEMWLPTGSGGAELNPTAYQGLPPVL